MWKLGKYEEESQRADDVARQYFAHPWARVFLLLLMLYLCVCLIFNPFHCYSITCNKIYIKIHTLREAVLEHQSVCSKARPQSFQAQNSFRTLRSSSRGYALVHSYPV